MYCSFLNIYIYKSSAHGKSQQTNKTLQCKHSASKTSSMQRNMEVTCITLTCYALKMLHNGNDSKIDIETHSGLLTKLCLGVM